MAAVVLRRPLYRVTIEPHGDALGRTYPGSRAFSLRRLRRDARAVRATEDEVIILLAAREAERRAGWRGPGGDGGDRASAEELAARVCTTDDEWSALLRLSRIRARQLVRKFWKAIRAVARILDARRALSGVAVRAIIWRT